MKSFFGGFWVDGAVRQPEQRHCDSDDSVLAKWKEASDEQTLGVSDEFDICRRSFSKWDCVYWLDTTPRESLTPEELWSVVKVLWPSVEIAHKHNDASWYVDNIENSVAVDWGNIDRYPSAKNVANVTRENVDKYLFKNCNCSLVGGGSGTSKGIVVGWIGDYCLVEIDRMSTPFKATKVEVEID